MVTISCTAAALQAAKDQQELRELKQVLISGGSPTAAAAAAHAAANAAGAAAAADSTSAGSAHSLLQRSVSGPPQVPAAPAVAAAAAAASNGPAACPELPQVCSRRCYVGIDSVYLGFGYKLVGTLSIQLGVCQNHFQ